MKISINRQGEIPAPSPMVGQTQIQANLSASDASSRREERRKKLWQRLKAEKGTEHLKSFIDEIARFEILKKPPISREELCRMRLECFTRLLQEAEGADEEARSVILGYLLPVCLRPRRDIPFRAWQAAQKRRGQSFARPLADVGEYWSWRESHETRDLLERWLRQLAPSQRQIARVPLLTAIDAAIHSAVADFDEMAEICQMKMPFHVAPFDRDDSETAPLTQHFRRVQAALSTLSHIGYRSKRIDELLGELIQRNDAIGSSALDTLAGLGIALDQREEVQRILRNQVYSQPSAHIAYAFQEIADRTQFDTAQVLFERTVFHSVEMALKEKKSNRKFDTKASSENDENYFLEVGDFEVLGYASLLQKFLARYPNEYEWHDRVWNSVWTLHRSCSVLSGAPHATFLGNGGKFRSCNSPWIARDVLLTLIPSFGDDPGDDQRAGSHFFRALALENLEKHVEPRALAGLANLAKNFSIGTDSETFFDLAMPWLRKDATFDTRYSDDDENWLQRLKSSAWNLILEIGLEPPGNWLELALASERSGHARGNVCDIVAQLRLPSIPPLLLDLVREQIDVPRQPPFGEFVSRIGAQRLLGASANYEAFEALLNAGFTMDGDLLMSTVNQLGECAYWLVREGDNRVVHQLILHCINSPSPRQREAAAGALRILAVRHVIPGNYAKPLSLLASDSSLAAYSRASLVEGLSYLIEVPNEDEEGVSKVLQSIFRDCSPEMFPYRNVRAEYDLGWYAAETLIRMGKLQTIADELFHRIGLESSINERTGGVFMRLKEGIELDSRASAALGSIWRQEVRKPSEYWSDIVTQIISRGKTTAVAPLLKVIVEVVSARDSFVPTATRTMIATSLLTRIQERQSSVRAETTLFEPLAVLSPELLLSLDWDKLWSNWLPDARVALAESIGTISNDIFGNPNHPLLSKALEVLRSLMGDSLYAARRVAYRILREKRPATLWLQCIDWTDNSDPQLRQRAAEAVAWLPETANDLFTPTTLNPLVKAVTGMGILTDIMDEAALVPAQIEALLETLRNDQEYEVREAAQRSYIERRKRELADQYLGIVEAAAISASAPDVNQPVPPSEVTNRSVLDAYRYGRALIHVGQDDHLNRLRILAKLPSLAPHASYWLNEILKPLESNWKQVTQKWPEPWLPWEGDVEELDGFISSKGKRFRAHFSLWHRPALTPQDYAVWGGAILYRPVSHIKELLDLGEEEALELSGFSLLMAGDLEMEIPGRPTTIVYCTRTGSNQASLISSNEPYPAENVS